MITERLNTKELFTSLDDTVSELLLLVSSFDEKQINTIPFKDSWTAAQVAEHITKSNIGIAQSLQREGEIIPRNADGRVEELKKLFLDFATKLQSPKFILPTQDIYAKETVLADLKKSIGQLKDVSSRVNLSEAIKHPALGEITKLEMLHFVVYHTQRHIHQLKKIFKATETKIETPFRHIISFMHISLDGFVAGSRSEMDWITMDEEIFKDAIDLEGSIDTALYGRTTFQMMESYWPTVLTNPSGTNDELRHAQWVENIPKIVFSKTLDKAEWNNTILIKENIAEEIMNLKQQPGKSMMIFGSPGLTHSFMKLGFIDEYRININPVVLGNGIPLFKNIEDRINLKLLKAKTFNAGVVGLHYETKQ
jgi:dihydrofolate reductase